MDAALLTVSGIEHVSDLGLRVELVVGPFGNFVAISFLHKLYSVVTLQPPTVAVVASAVQIQPVNADFHAMLILLSLHH